MHICFNNNNNDTQARLSVNLPFPECYRNILDKANYHDYGGGEIRNKIITMIINKNAYFR